MEAAAGAAGVATCAPLLGLTRPSCATRPLQFVTSPPAIAVSPTPVAAAAAPSGPPPTNFEGSIGSGDYWMWAGQSGRM